MWRRRSRKAGRSRSRKEKREKEIGKLAARCVSWMEIPVSRVRRNRTVDPRKSKCRSGTGRPVHIRSNGLQCAVLCAVATSWWTLSLPPG